MKIEVVEIYPHPDKGKFLERGSVHVFIEELGLDLKNIPYHIKSERNEERLIYHAHISPPCYVYKQLEEDGSTKFIPIPTISFRDKNIWKSIKKAIQQEVLEQFEPSIVSSS